MVSPNNIKIVFYGGPSAGGGGPSAGGGGPSAVGGVVAVEIKKKQF